MKGKKEMTEQGSEAVVVDRVAARRAAMPEVSAFIDWARRSAGADVVDAAMAKGIDAACKHAHILATQGQQAADAWHRQHAHLCTFFASEGGRTVGLRAPDGRDVRPPQAMHQYGPPIGTPGALTRQGNSTPLARASGWAGEKSGNRSGSVA